jgi:hypothetical protein
MMSCDPTCTASITVLSWDCVVQSVRDAGKQWHS